MGFSKEKKRKKGAPNNNPEIEIFFHDYIQKKRKTSEQKKITRSSVNLFTFVTLKCEP